MIFCPISDQIDNGSALNRLKTHHENSIKETVVEDYIANDIYDN